MDVTTRYESQDRISEFHHIQNNTLTNLTIPININLHDLKTVDSTTFLITFENKDFLPEENALIDITENILVMEYLEVWRLERQMLMDKH